MHSPTFVAETWSCGVHLYCKLCYRDIVCYLQITLERHKDEKELSKVEKKFWVPEKTTIAQLGVKIRYGCGSEEVGRK